MRVNVLSGIILSLTMVTTWTDVNKIGFTQVHNWTILSKTCGERSLLCDSFWNIKIQLGQSHKKKKKNFNGSVCKAVIVIYHYCLNHIERSECSFRSITEWFQLQYPGYFSSRVECVYIYIYKTCSTFIPAFFWTEDWISDQKHPLLQTLVVADTCTKQVSGWVLILPYCA